MTKLIKYNSKKTAEGYFKDDNTGKILLPNFQRKFVWTPDQQKKLIASALAGVPIGSVLLLKSEKTDMAVRQLCFNDMKINADKNASREYLLDGQQRFSSLKNAFLDVCDPMESGTNQNRETLKRNLPENLQIRWFLDIENVDFDLQNASFKEKRDISPTHYIGKLHFTKDEKFWQGEEYDDELKKHCVKERRIPLWKMSGARYIHDILKQIQYASNSDIADKVRENWALNVYQHLKSRTLGTTVPNIEIDQSAMEIAIEVFEQVNTSGTKLSILDILAAKMAEKEERPLLDLMKGDLKKKDSYFGEPKWAPLELPDSKQKFWDKETPAKTFQSAYVNCLAIACYIKNNSTDPRAKKFPSGQLKQGSLYKLEGKTIKDCWKKTLKNLIHAYAFLVNRCGVVTFNDIQFQLMILPIFTAIHAIDRRKFSENESKKFFDRLEYWYWRALFDGKYREQQNKRVIEDIRRICDFCEGKKNAEDFEFDEGNKHLMQLPDFSDFNAVSLIGPGVNQQLTKPMLQFMLSRKPCDPKDMSIELTAWKLMLGEEKIHLDHILPVRSRRGNSKDRFNSALMRTYLLGTTNQNKKDNTHNLHDLFAANHTIQVRHLIPNDIGRIGKNYAADGNGEDEADKIAKKFMEKRHTMFLDELKAHLTKLKKSVKS